MHFLSALVSLKRILLQFAVAVAFLVNVGPALGQATSGDEVVLDGEVEVFHVDFEDHSRSRTDYFLKLAGSDEALQMRFENRPPRGLAPGAKVTVRGRAVGRQIWVSTITPQADEGTDTTGDGDGTAPAVGPTDEHDVITMMINIRNTDGTLAWEWSAGEEASLTGELFTNRYSVDGVYLEGSYGQVGYPQSLGQVVVVTTDKSPNCAYYDYASWADAAAAALGQDPASYRNRLYVLPTEAYSACGWLALGQVGSYGNTNNSYRSWTTRIDALAIAHEFGHNNGWHHAAIDPDNDSQIGSQSEEYGDWSGLMGYCCAERKFNAVHVEQIGWLDAWSGRVQTVTAGGTYTIAALGTDPAATTQPQVLRIPRTDPNQTIANSYYYLSFKELTGLDSAMPSGYRGVAIHHGRDGGIWSFLIDNLTTDGSSTAIAADGLTVTRVSSGTGTVDVFIAFDACIGSAPTVTMTPPSVTNTTDGDESFSATLQDNRSGECDPVTYTLAGSATGGAQSTLDPTSVSLAPGASADLPDALSVSAGDGVYTVTLSASGNATSASDSSSLTVDAVGPAFPTGAALSFSTFKRKKFKYVRVGWPAADNPGGTVDHYEVTRAGGSMVSVTGTSYSDTGALADLDHTYSVVAVDDRGRRSAQLDGTYTPGSGDGGNGGGGGGKPKTCRGKNC